MVTIEDARRQLSQPFRPERKAMSPHGCDCASTSSPLLPKLWSLPRRFHTTVLRVILNEAVGLPLR
jgi:hypothetical protein